MTDPSPTRPGQDAPDNGRRLHRLIRAQRDLYRQLHDLATQQRQALENGSTQAVLGVLARRQGVIDELTEVAGKVSAAGARWSELADELPDDERADLRSTVDEVKRLAEEVMHRDAEDEATLRGMRREAGGELRTFHASRSAASAYQQGRVQQASAPSAAPSRFADRNA